MLIVYGAEACRIVSRNNQYCSALIDFSTAPFTLRDRRPMAVDYRDASCTVTRASASASAVDEHGKGNHPCASPEETHSMYAARPVVNNAFHARHEARHAVTTPDNCQRALLALVRTASASCVTESLVFASGSTLTRGRRLGATLDSSLSLSPPDHSPGKLELPNRPTVCPREGTWEVYLVIPYKVCSFHGRLLWPE